MFDLPLLRQVVCPISGELFETPVFLNHKDGVLDGCVDEQVAKDFLKNPATPLSGLKIIGYQKNDDLYQVVSQFRTKYAAQLHLPPLLQLLQNKAPLQEIRDLLDCDPDEQAKLVTAVGGLFGRTALFFAAKFHPEALPIIVNAAPHSITATNEYDGNALLLALRFNQIHAVTTLMGASSLDAQSTFVTTLAADGSRYALHTAIHYCPLAIPMILGAMQSLTPDVFFKVVSHQEQEGQNILMHAAWCKRVEFPTLLETISKRCTQPQIVALLQQQEKHGYDLVDFVLCCNPKLVVPLLGEVSITANLNAKQWDSLIIAANAKLYLIDLAVLIVNLFPLHFAKLESAHGNIAHYLLQAYKSAPKEQYDALKDSLKKLAQYKRYPEAWLALAIIAEIEDNQDDLMQHLGAFEALKHTGLLSFCDENSGIARALWNMCLMDANPRKINGFIEDFREDIATIKAKAVPDIPRHGYIRLPG